MESTLDVLLETFNWIIQGQLLKPWLFPGLQTHRKITLQVIPSASFRASGLHESPKAGHVRLENQSPPDHQTIRPKISGAFHV